MRSLLNYATVACLASSAASRAVVLEERAENTTIAAPIVAVPSTHWEGIDGTWSTFTVRVGTPASGVNTYRVLPATSLEETWVVYAAAQDVCDTSLGVPSNCADLRGGQFDSANSPTWTELHPKNATADQFDLGLDTQAGYSGVGQYGFDTVGLGFTASQGPTLPQQVVSEIVSNTFWFGLLGLSFEPVNFTSFANTNNSFATSLHNQGTIASKTWSYTAGASYQLGGKIYGSLIFGGYDASRFVPNSARFSMNADPNNDLSVNIRSMVGITSGKNTTLLNTPIYALIDSAIPELWLPTIVCKQFEAAFGIALDSGTGQYLVSNTTHQKLLATNPTVTITLGDAATGGSSVDIALPYAAFDLSIGPPEHPNSTSYYFPLMPTDDKANYRLGRTFLQEAYVTANYDTRTFNVSQCTFDDNASAQVIAIPTNAASATKGSTEPSGTTGPKPSHHKKLGGGAIAGIVVAVLLAIAVAASVIACCLLGLLCFPSRKHKEKGSRPSTPVVEIDAGRRVEPLGGTSAYNDQASAFVSEVSGKDAKVEIQGNPIMHPQELEAEVPMMAGAVPADRVSGPSDASRATDSTGVSSMSPITEYPARTPMAELGAQERGLGFGTTSMGERIDHEHIVSPVSPRNSAKGFGTERDHTTGGAVNNPTIQISSPTISEATWDPSTPVNRSFSGSRFQERFSDRDS